VQHSSSQLWQQGNTFFWLALGIALLVGASVWVMPFNPVMMFWPIVAIVAISVTIYLLKRPETSYIAAILTYSMFTIQVASIHLFDVLSILTGIGLVFRYFNQRNFQKVSVLTRLDWWILPLFAWMFFKGITSLNQPTGTVYAIRFLLGFSFYYLTVYFVRTRLISLSSILLAMLGGVMIQVAWGVFQNITGQGYLANAGWAINDRNYFAFLGLGSTKAQQAMGSFYHFAPYGHFLAVSAMFFFPFLLYAVPKQKKWLLLYCSIFWAVIVSYSRGALSTFIAISGYMSFFFPHYKVRLLSNIRWLFMVFAGLAVFIMLFKNYGSTLAPRNDMWAVTGYYFEQHPEHFWWGSGLRGLESTLFNYIPRYIAFEHVSQFAPHNFYLVYIHQLGIFGMLFILLGFATILISTFKTCFMLLRYSFKSENTIQPSHLPYKRIFLSVAQWKRGHWAWWSVNAGCHLAIGVVLFGGINDHIFADTYMFTWLLLMFAILYSVPWKNHQDYWIRCFDSERPA
jgi:hypothetical protein